MAEASGHYRTESRDFLINNRRFSVDSGKNMHLFLFGPRFSLRKYERITPFVQAMAGQAHARTSATRTFAPDPTIKRSNSEMAFAAGAGFGLDSPA
ncbi:MAG TPA: hypothetical protein VJQ56_12555 [Blastocatellia bacterium]|nr:hypothetical protein [Blastocatellia bacterium]